MNILILGSTGYLGSNIANRLSKEAHNVFCVVRSTSDISRLENMGVYLISNEFGEVESALKLNNIDWIINGVCTYKINNTLYGDILESNIVFPLSILNLAVKYNVKNFMTIGTSLPAELNLYSFSKHKFSEFGRYLSERNNINFADLQLEMFYGGLFEPDDRFISSCRHNLEHNITIELTEGLQKRDIIRVEDVVEIISRLIYSDYLRGFKKLPVGSGEQHSIREIVEFMKAEIGSMSEIKYGAIPSRIGEPDTLADISWYKDLGYKLKYTYFDGLQLECADENHKNVSIWS